MAGELFFPSAENCDSTVTPTRQVTVPVAFENVMQYRQVFKAALRGRRPCNVKGNAGNTRIIALIKAVLLQL